MAGRLSRGQPRASRAQLTIPIHQHVGQVAISPVEILLPPLQSQEQGIGKSPGFRWPWYRFWESRKPPNRRTTWPMRFRNPIGRGLEGQDGSVTYLQTYLQGNRHAWPGGGIIEYPATQTLNTLAKKVSRG